MFKDNRNLLIIALIAIVNSVGYGIIIPILYSYSVRYGLSDFQNGLLFATFSICQFISTPLIGRMSDKYGRRPLLLISLAGTALSFFMAAFAPSALFLFLARGLDGLTAGNVPVASAVITDTTSEKDRAKGFGIIGASFGFGFVVGPAISALTVGINPSLPFIIAGIISVIAVVVTAIFLPETNKHIGAVKKGKLFDFGALIHALFDRNIGPTLIITLIYFCSFFMFVYAFQPFGVKNLHMKPNGISLLYTLFGFIGLITQLFLVQRFVARFGLKPTYAAALLFVSGAFLALFFANSVVFFVIACALLGLPNSFVQPLTQTILSKETDAKSQGTMQGLNASYMSIGQILGPILGGALATFGISYPFLAASVGSLVCLALSTQILKGKHKESAF